MKPFKYVSPKVHGGDLKTPVVFYEYKPHDSPEPGEEERKVLYKCFADVYNPSVKDLQILNNTSSVESITLNIRDPHEDYVATTKHYIEIDDFRYSGKRFNVKFAGPDLEKNNCLKIIAVVGS
ncbi:phage head-tail adapter protein [Listeria newyorkensis]|uniref:Phage head-tail adapter protein n=1 Tax=Listeria newyorkensis TaxID=1497681 RepID=A0A841YY57_9LIST|nr:phage head-tail adapter protein [Listeria newyorkensis]MBC1458474.1 phage head-tail adapter protein [Listeria newyorkensis]